MGKIRDLPADVCVDFASTKALCFSGVSFFNGSIRNVLSYGLLYEGTEVRSMYNTVLSV